MKTLNCVILHCIVVIKVWHKMIQQQSKSECNLRPMNATMQLNRHKLNISNKMTLEKFKDCV